MNLLIDILVWLIEIAIVAIVIFSISGLIFEKSLGVSSMPTMPRVKRRMISLVSPEASGNIVEFGCGCGGIALAAAKAFPDRQVIGIEYSPVPFMISKIRLFLNPSVKNLSFIRKNFFEFNLPDTSIVLCYLSNPIMKSLREKFMAELPTGAQIVSSTFFIPDWDSEKIEKLTGLWSTEIFVYRKKTV